MDADGCYCVAVTAAVTFRLGRLFQVRAEPVLVNGGECGFCSLWTVADVCDVRAGWPTVNRLPPQAVVKRWYGGDGVRRTTGRLPPPVSLTGDCTLKKYCAPLAPSRNAEEQPRAAAGTNRLPER
jgi:hypothetical protein